MRVPIYEALAHYKKNEELPYTEYFGLGFFSDRSLAEEALVESKILSGFSKLNDDSFSIKTHYLNDCAHIGDDINYEIVNNKIYGVWYDYDIDPYYSSSGYIGLFSTLEYAEKALDWYKTWDILKIHGLEYLGIYPITLNLRGWTEGFITVNN
ncbi:hypothetical protein [Veillonella parvula]|uniref:hypothetical protein n=1 Tax=Veillonella parvula TaxID=29466 RepID=UPI0007673FFC|nr:hypothetical protein [Veillonella parvula]KXB82941.1 hypothetical protein HMPREF1865_01734 [Veillonella parvula]